MSSVSNRSSSSWDWTLDHAQALQAGAFPGQQGPGCWTLNLQPLQAFDSSALALLLHWRRQAQQQGAQWRVEHVPPGLLELAQVYGVDGWLALESQATKS
jgi:phospholipid transport system transporter-binding protein